LARNRKSEDEKFSELIPVRFQKQTSQILGNIANTMGIDVSPVVRTIVRKWLIDHNYLQVFDTKLHKQTKLVKATHEDIIEIPLPAHI